VRWLSAVGWWVVGWSGAPTCVGVSFRLVNLTLHNPRRTHARTPPAVFGQDHWGHGLSGGFKGDIEDFEYLVNDLKQLVLDQRKAFAGQLPFFIIGASRA
jgi:hypothetical protein